jgi:AraC-like DNA-binding protein
MAERGSIDRRNCAAFWLKGVVEAFEADGLEVPALFSEVGLEMAALQDLEARLPTDKVSLLWHRAVMRSGNPIVGLMHSRSVKPAYFDIVSYTMMSAPTLGGLLEQLGLYVGIISDVARVSLSDGSEGIRCTLELPGDQLQVPWQRFAYDLLTLVSFCRWVANRDLRPVALELVSPMSIELASHCDALGIPVRFLMPSNSVIFSHKDVQEPLPTAHNLLVTVVEGIARERLHELDHAETSLRARTAIVDRLAQGEPRRAEVARALGISERTLHRRLEAEGTSFVKLVDDTRRGMAEQYLGGRNLSLADIASLLGFADLSSLSRASRRWFGSTPRRHRTRLMVSKGSRSD